MNDRPIPYNGFTAKIVFDWSKNPVRIDFNDHGGRRRFLGILKLDGDRLILATSNDGRTRPVDFAETRLIDVHHFTRVKK